MGVKGALRYLAANRPISLESLQTLVATLEPAGQYRLICGVRQDTDNTTASPGEPDSLYVEILRERIVAGKQGHRVLSEWDAASELVGLFGGAWKERPRQKHSHRAEETLLMVRSALETICRSGDAAAIDVVLLRVLEDIFQARGVAVYFGDWRRDRSLMPIYNEAVDLAGIPCAGRTRRVRERKARRP